MINLHPQQSDLTDFQNKIATAFEQSLTEEQRFLYNVMIGKEKLIPHEEIMADLRRVLKR